MSTDAYALGMDLVTQAKMFATQKHVLDNRQLYGSILPYTHHLADVAGILRQRSCDDEIIIAAAWLHDVVEDTRDRDNEVRVRDLQEMFGDEVAALVDAVTSEPGANRKIRNALTYPKIRAGGERAIALKLADRLANVRFGGRAVEMYRREHAEFRHALWTPGESPAYVVPGVDAAIVWMWGELDERLKP